MTLPPTTLLGEIRASFADTATHNELRDALELHFGRYLRDLVVRFVLTERFQLSDAPNTMNLGEFQALARQGRAAIVIDEGGVGASADVKPRELV